MRRHYLIGMVLIALLSLGASRGLAVALAQRSLETCEDNTQTPNPTAGPLQGISDDDGVIIVQDSIPPASIKVACVGDSITYGTGIDDRLNHSYPAQLQRLLGSEYTVGNFGHSGARVSHIQKKWYKKLPEFSQSLDFEPEIVFIALGINDCTITQWEANKPHFISDYRALIADYKALTSHPKIYLGTLMPVVHPHGQVPAINNGPMIECAALIEQIATEEDLPLIDLYTCLEMEPQYYADDGIHPDEYGTGIIADIVYKAITADHGGLKMPWVFGNHMVLQRGKSITVFGTADVGSTVTVKLGTNTAQATADANGRWRVDMPAMDTGGPYMLICQTATTALSFSDVMIGEVWVASGQSNMAWRMKQDADWATEAPLADHYPNIRLLSREASTRGSRGQWDPAMLEKVTVDDYYHGEWKIGSQSSASMVSAVAYYFAKEIHIATGVAVGIIDNAVGGTTMEAYTPLMELYKDERHQLTDNWLNASKANDWHRGRASQNLALWLNGQRDTPMPHHPFEPAFLFNADIADLIPFAIRGVLWYQGESNATDSSHRITWPQEWNHCLFEGLINSWRACWGQGEFPFYYVQLPNLNREWMQFREMQLETLDRVPNTGIAVTIDIGDPNNVHPAAKKEVGRRLSLWARAQLYGESDLVYSGPLYNGMFADEGSALRVGFDHVGGGLQARGGGVLTGFELAGSDGCWLPAMAVVDGSEIVLNNELDDPQAVRYAWAQNPVANLENTEGLPASPFRAGDMNFEVFSSNRRPGGSTGAPSNAKVESAVNVSAPFKHIHVFFIGGQSNAAGSGANADFPAVYQTLQMDIEFWQIGRLPGDGYTHYTAWDRDGDQTFKALQLGSGNNRDGSQSGFEMSLGRTLKDVFPSWNIAVVKYAMSGSALARGSREDGAGDWSPEGFVPGIFTGIRYAVFKNNGVDRALQAISDRGDTYTIEAMFWYQGESDAGNALSAANYENHMKAFIAAVRNDFNAPDMKFFAGRLRKGIDRTYLATVRKAVENLAASDPLTWWIDTDGLSVNSDNLHFDAAGCVELGNRFGNAFIEAELQLKQN